jgi:hypothetical protein
VLLRTSLPRIAGLGGIDSRGAIPRGRETTLRAGLKGLEGGGESISSGSFAALRMTAETRQRQIRQGQRQDKAAARQRPGCGWEKMWVEKRISPLRCSQKREQPRSK